MMKVSQYIVRYLKSKGIHTVFGYIGGYNADMLDCFCADKGNRFVLNYHEQASAFAVNTYAELTGKVGVATASGAPSFCNMVAGIANAYFDSHPCVFILGSAHSLAVRKDKSIRQNAFEEIDAVSMVKDITKYAVKVTNPEDVRYELEKCFCMASEGRKGPTVIDIPYNIIRSDIDIHVARPYVVPERCVYDEIDFDEIASRLRAAKRPLILLGGGAGSAESREALKVLLDKVRVPVVASLCGLDILPHDHNCFAGFVGHYGNRYANLAMKHSDFLLILGSRLDERQLGGFKTRLSDDVFIVRVDMERPELKRKLPENLSYCSSVEVFLSGLLNQDLSGLNFSQWIDCIARWKMRYPSIDVDVKNLGPLNFIRRLSSVLPRDAIICSDVGQNQMCVAQAMRLDGERRLFNSAGYGSMGFSLPAAIGCAFAKPGTCIVSVNGDGGIQMNIQELQTLRRDNLPVNIIVLNNHCLGMIRKTQEKLFNGKDFISVNGYAAPDFAKIAKAYDMSYMCVDSVEDCEKVGEFISDDHPTFIEVNLPMIMENVPEPGGSIEGQYPELSELEKVDISIEAGAVNTRR